MSDQQQNNQLHPRPWLKNYPPYTTWEQKFEPHPIQDLIDNSAIKYPDSTHIDFFGRTFSYTETKEMSDKVAKGLQKLGVGPGVHVGIYMPNIPQYIILYFAILKAGGTIVNFSPLYSKPELETQVKDSGCEFMVTLDNVLLYPKMAGLLGKTTLKKIIVCELDDVLPPAKRIMFKLFGGKKRCKIPNDDGHVFYKTLLDNDGSYTKHKVDVHEDIVLLQYTGGTTGLPKGAMLTHANLSINLQQAIAWDIALEPGKGQVLSVLPLFHIYALALVMNVCTALGGNVVLLPRYDPKQMLSVIRRYKIQFLPVVPTIMTGLINEPSRKPEDLRSIKICISGGAPLPLELGEEFLKLIGANAIRQGYGLTESSPLAVGNPVEGSDVTGTVGLPLPDTEIIITDKEDPTKILDVGETGEICIQGPQVMKGYWKRPEATSEMIVEGRLRTGDVGYLDENGNLFIIDRMKDMILVGGINVFPRVIEEALFEHPDVSEATVIGVPDTYSGEKPKAFVVAVEGDEHKLSEANLMEYLKDIVGKHEMPREIEFRSELPKTPVGKLSKKELVAEELEKLNKK
ncbi:MAG: long-chain fatty acid--CoA ligase [Sphingomonadales bacterium]|nr:long-chain fatty acid--CoA ligase [Sphingomonadales bacterium]